MMMAMGLLIGGLLVATLAQQPRGLGQAVGFSLMLGTGFVGLLFIYSMLADLIPRDSERCGRNRSAFLFALLRSEEHTSELQSLMRISYAVFCLKKKIKTKTITTTILNDTFNENLE